MSVLDQLVATRARRPAQPQAPEEEPEKAVTGTRVWDYGVPLGTATQQYRDPKDQRAFIKVALGIYHTDRHIKRAERVITQRVAGLPWHLEDEEENEVDDDNAQPGALAVRDLLEKPTGGVRIGSQPSTWRELAGITVRHAGLVNVAFWFLDQIDGLAGWPRQILYIRPDRMTPKLNAKGELDHWGLDETSDGKYGRLELDEVLPFYVEPPDQGYYGEGLVRAALDLARKTRLSDSHEIDVLDAGGRLAGIVSPKQPHVGQDLEPDAFDRLQLDLRNIVDMPDAAKRTLVSRAPVDFIPTAADLQKLQTVEIAKLTREEKFGLWGVHPEVAGFPGVGGLNSGERGNYQEATTWQNGCQPRADMLVETLQYHLLDRLLKVGLNLQFRLHTPTFDDDLPKFEMAQKAEKQPLTQKERRAIVGLPPFDDLRDEEVWIGDQRIYPVAAPVEPPQLPPGLVVPPQLEAGPLELAGGPEVKAGALDLRRLADRAADRAAARLGSFLAVQRAEVARLVEERGARVLRKPDDWSLWFDADKWDRELERILEPVVEGLVDLAADRVGQLAPAPAKAIDPYTRVLNQALKRAGVRIKGINATTRREVAAVVKAGVADGASPAEIGRRLRESQTFSEARALTIARTETGTALNQAQVAGYRDLGVEHVRVIDGDQDAGCAAANGATWTLDEAEASPLEHPNCVRDFAPVIGGA